MELSDKAAKKKRWPLLQKAEELGCISFEDLALAELLLGGNEEGKELSAALICHLSKAVREGHLCIRKEQGILKPCPKVLWLSEVEEDLAAEIAPLIEKMIEEKIDLPKGLVETVSEDSSKVPLTPICRFENLYYFQKYWLFESSFFASLKDLLSKEPEIKIDASFVEPIVESMKEKGVLVEEQKDAIISAIGKTFSIISGGPGTGKTYTAGHLIKILWNSLDEEQKKRCEIALAAPTGKAANNLQKSLDKAFLDEKGQKPKISSKTLHALLRLESSSGKMEKNGQSKLSADIVLVDESSMIDVRLISCLFDSIKPGARLILLGDPYQLPPVEAGSVFNDIVKLLQKSSVFELKKCLRQELKEIVDFSEMINRGDFKSVFSFLSTKRENPSVSCVEIASSGSIKKVLEKVLACIEKELPSEKFSPCQSSLELLQSFNRFRLLSPMRKGLFGVKEINRLVHFKRLSMVSWNEYFVSPIIVAANDYKMNLFNGETGVLISKKTKRGVFEEGDFALFPGGGAETLREIPAIFLPKFEYAYCLSVHKSQGSEFDSVLLLLPQGSQKFGREILYTAVTRAKRNLKIWSSYETLQETIHFRSERMSAAPLKRLLFP